MRVTMNDIAKKLNISVNTVSKALNGKSKISEELRSKVIETANKMGYVKNKHASSLAMAPFKIGVIICGYDKNYYKYTIEGLEKAFRSLIDGNISYEISLFEIDDSVSSKVMDKLSWFEAEGFNGIIINDFHSPLLSDRIKCLREKGIEIVLLNYDLTGSNRSFSVTNNYSLSAYMAAELMAISLKHSENKNVILGTLSRKSFGQNELYKNFKEAAAKYGLHLCSVSDSVDDLIDSITPDIMGIYITHAKSIKICEKIEKLNRESGFTPTLIVSDLYDEMIPYIESSIITATVYQDPVKQAYDAVIKLYNILLGTEKKEDVIIKPKLLLKSSYTSI